MAFVTSISPADASGPVRDMYEHYQEQLGYVPNYAKLFSLRPEVMDKWSALSGAIRRNMSTRAYELATVAAARALRSSYCMLAHGSVLATKVLNNSASVVQIVEGQGAALLEPKEQAMMAFAEKIATRADQITSADIDTLRSHGYCDEEIFDIAATAAARCFFSKLLDALGAQPDSAYGQLNESLRSALLVGRPISEEPVERVNGSHEPETQRPAS